MDIKFIKQEKLKEKFKNEKALGFGKIFTDYMFCMDYVEGEGWINPVIMPYQNFSLSPATTVLHYGQTIFEGLKAYKQKDGTVNLFRPKDNFKRFNKSAERMCIPQTDEEFLFNATKKLIKLEQDWIPKEFGSSLYIRPTIIATDSYIGLAVSQTYKLFIILSPVGPYYAEGFNPTKIWVTKEYVRAVRGGLGEAKTAANYAASLYASKIAIEKGYTQVLWLDGVEQKYVDEVGSSNIFFVINDVLVTPVLNGGILAGITRDSVLKLADNLGIKIEERQISIDEVVSAYKDGSLQEVFASGTAAIISPIGQIIWEDEVFTINNNEVGKISKNFFDLLMGIQYGEKKDIFNWIEKV